MIEAQSGGQKKPRARFYETPAACQLLKENSGEFHTASEHLAH